jgi:exosortase A
MPPEALGHAPPPAALAQWPRAAIRLALGWAALFAATLPEWREMAHQWWDIDTYAHIVLIPPILAWLVWLRRDALSATAPAGWFPGVAAAAAGLAVCLSGRILDTNLIAQTGAVIALQGAVLAVLGARVALVLAFPLAYAAFLVPFGDEIVAPLQQVTAGMAVALTHASGVPAVLHGLFIDTPAGRFVVAEECSGVKFLIAMVTLGTLIAWTAFRSWWRRAALLLGTALISVLANGIRAWGTIYVAQYVGAERAGGFDHIVYGWIFFAVVIGLVLAIAWRFFEREPAEAGVSAAQADMIAARLGLGAIDPNHALAAVAGMAMVFAVAGRLV